MGHKLQRKVTGSRGSRVVSSTLALLAILLFVLYTAGDFSELFAALAGDSSDDSQSVQAMISNIKLEIESSSSMGAAAGGGARRAAPASATAISSAVSAASVASVASAASQQLVGTNVVHGPTNFKHCNADFDPAHNFQEILNTSPVVLFVNADADSRDLKSLLSTEYEISPAPSVVDLDKHSCGSQLDAYIRKHALRSVSPQVSQPPYLLVNGRSVINRGLRADVLEPHDDGVLLDKLKKIAGTEVMVSRTNAPSNS
ncbi:LAFE_0G08570g1_1 [Lachancea fermentati]|uniref:LAFE_0G08570g1_1 n=1 Tax=Lachancea fermentati TaxID=4955 RepID=A0A1G4MHN2_LACFM|nr:LAFE_0G08570g1_1 [Lachancea fermentati]